MVRRVLITHQGNEAIFSPTTHLVPRWLPPIRASWKQNVPAWLQVNAVLLLSRVARRALAPLIQSDVCQLEIIGVQAPALDEFANVTEFLILSGH
jgi:hypothetical protein